MAVLATTFAVFPLLGLASQQIGAVPDGMRAGLLFLTLLPSTVQSSIAFTAIARGNVAAFGLSHRHSLTEARAPEGLDALPVPDAVFIGGSGGELAGLITLCLQRLRPGGRLVMNFVTLENLATATAALTQAGAAWGATWDVLQLQAARSKPILAMHRLAAENPVWIVCAEKAVADV